MREPGVGDRIKTIGDCGFFFKDGTTGVLTFQDEGGGWWANLSEEAFALEDRRAHGRELGPREWCVGPYPAGFELIDD